MTGEETSAGGIRRWVGLGATLLATFMGILDVFIVNVAAPSIQTTLHASFADLQLVLAGYVLAYAVGLVTGGRLGDAHGRRRLFLIGVAAFTLTSIGCSLAPTPPALIVIRVLQGFAAALMLPQVLSLVQVSFAEPQRQTALGLYGATIGLGSIAGQLIGGALIHADIAGLGWRTVFLVNVPIGIVACALALPTIAESRSEESTPLDLRGVVLLGTGLALLLYPLVEGSAFGWPGWMFVLLVAACMILIGFVLVERRLGDRGGAPVLPARLFTQRGFSVGLPVALVFYSGTAGLFLLLAYFLQDGLGLSALGSGLVFLPLGVGFAIASLTSRALVARCGPRVLIVGAIAMAVGLGIAAFTPLQPVPAQVLALLPALLLAGIGQGLIAAPLIGTVLAGVRPADAGAASGGLLTATQVANALGVAVIGAVFTLLLGARPGTSNASQHAFHDAFTGTLLVLIALAAATGLLLAILQRRQQRPDAGLTPRPTRA